MTIEQDLIAITLINYRFCSVVVGSVGATLLYSSPVAIGRNMVKPTSIPNMTSKLT